MKRNNDLYNLISMDDELKQLYQNDTCFHTTVANIFIGNEISIQEALITIIKQGYKQKNYIEKLMLQDPGRC